MQSQSLKVWVIRHGTTLLNKLEKEFKMNGKIFDKFDLDGLLDCPISEDGVKQSISLQDEINKLDLKYVFVSPLRRALQTSYYLLQKYPKKSRLQIYVHPLLREVLHNANDIPCDFLNEVVPLYEKYSSEGLNYNFNEYFNGYKSKRIYFAYDLQTNASKELLEELANEKNLSYNDILKIVVNFIKKYDRDSERIPVESLANVRSRGEKFVSFLQNFINEKKILPENVLVVSHANLLSSLFMDQIYEHLVESKMCIPNAKLVQLDIANFKSLLPKEK